MPVGIASPQTSSHKAMGTRFVPRSSAAIVVRGGRFHRQGHQPEVFVDRDLIPDARVAIYGPRAVFPGLLAQLAGPRDGVKIPKFFPRPYIEGANPALGVVVRRPSPPLLHVGAA